MDTASVPFATIDYVIFGIYLLVIVGLGLWVSQEEEGQEKSSSDYFLASKSLPFWAIGSSLIAANISAEQFIGMSGSGFRVGLAIASYEWMAAITLLVIAHFFLPIYLEKEIFTMPQFLEQRYDGRVRMLLAIFWLLVYVFVNLTSVLYMGGLSINVIMGVPLGGRSRGSPPSPRPTASTGASRPWPGPTSCRWWYSLGAGCSRPGWPSTPTAAAAPVPSAASRS